MYRLIQGSYRFGLCFRVEMIIVHHRLKLLGMWYPVWASLNNIFFCELGLVTAFLMVESYYVN